MNEALKLDLQDAAFELRHNADLIETWMNKPDKVYSVEYCRGRAEGQRLAACAIEKILEEHA